MTVNLGPEGHYGPQACGFAIADDPDGATCGAPATWHLAFGNPAEDEIETGATCDDHASSGWTVATESHPISPMCNMPATHWLDGTCKWVVDEETLRMTGETA